MVTELLTAIRFLTRLPVPTWGQASLSRSVAWFPAAGLLVGAAAAAAHALALWLFPPLAAAWAAVVAEMVVTGALHPDGLADTLDGFGGRTPQARLRIMKDPRLGSYGGVGLLLALAGRMAFLSALPPYLAPAALVAAHGAARWGPVWGLARYPYARSEGGTGAVFAQAGMREVGVAAALALGSAWLLLGMGGLVVAAAAGGAGMVAAAGVARRLGGLTGDAYGALAEIGLLAALAAAAAGAG